MDPIRGMIRVTIGADLEVEVGPEELTKRKPQEEGEERKKKKTKDRKEGKEIAEKEIMPPTTPFQQHHQPSLHLETLNFLFLFHLMELFLK